MNALVIGPGPGFPFLHEARAITRALALDPARTAFVAQQRASRIEDAIDEIAAAARAHADATGGPVVAIGISLGASFAVEAAVRDPSPFRAIVGLGLDVDIPAADAAAHAFVMEHGDARARAAASTFAAPTTAKAFQRRAKWIAELGGVQPGTRWGAMMRKTVFALLRTRGPIGAIRALRAMTRIQNAMLPQLSSWTLDHVRSLAVPISLVHGARDAVVPHAHVRTWIDALGAPSKSLRVVDEIGHLPHVEAPNVVREVIAAYSTRALAA